MVHALPLAMLLNPFKILNKDKKVKKKDTLFNSPR